ncbi:hypothetical protein N7G274_000694 [Stereocaulon virgatum]|uniref:Uncharacterized protein n=1 Tax=Stereocaulon virgatum TaxID=373712 RepID=A0ABR4APH6_9LECA
MAGSKNVSQAQLLLLLLKTLTISLTVRLPSVSDPIQALHSRQTTSRSGAVESLTWAPQSNNFDYQCFSLFIRPLFDDCQMAIHHFPVSPLPGDFHTGPPLDIFSLPVERTYKTCRVLVELIRMGDTETHIYWSQLVARASDLNYVCKILEPVRSRTVTGGSIYAGRHGGIMITLGYHFNRLPQGAEGKNATSSL